MTFKSFFYIGLLLIFFNCSCLTSLAFFRMDGGQGKNQEEADIPVIFSADERIKKRQKEAYKLIEEGRQLVRKGQKKSDQNLIARGKIKKEIGKKQLELLKEQVEERKRQDNELR